MLNIDLDKVVSSPRIRYELPLSKVIQALKGNSKIETSWSIVKKFLLLCTNVIIEKPDRLVLTINKHEERETAYLEKKQFNFLAIQKYISMDCMTSYTGK